MTSPDYTFHVGEKFEADGSLRRYPGSTVICFTDSASAFYQAGEQVQAQLMAQPYGHKFACLPPSSFHMTVFSLICHERNIPDQWAAELPLDATLAESDEFFIPRVQAVPAPNNFRMVMTYLGGSGLSFVLSPADAETDLALWDYRQRLSVASGVRYPDHDSYRFHMTLAYNLIKLNDEETHAFAQWRRELGERLRGALGVLELGAPQLTLFDDMGAFYPLDQRHLLQSRL